MKLSCLLTVASAVAIAVTTVPANAATVVQNLTLTGNFGSTVDANVVFTLNFDNSNSFDENSTGVSLVSTNLSGPLQIGYNAVSDSLTLVGGGGSAFANSCSYAPGSFCTFIDNVSTSPATNFFGYYSTSREFSFANNVTLVTTGSAVPEPATWAMMFAGFGMIGFAARRRSNVKMTVAYA